MKKKDISLLWEAYVGKQRPSKDNPMRAGTIGNLHGVDPNAPVGDEHNPGEPSNVDTGAMYQAMDRHNDLAEIAHKYEGMSDSQLQAHAEVLDGLIEAGEQGRMDWFNGDAGPPF